MTILPALPQEFHCGRLVNVEIPGIGKIDLEWSKHTIRRMIVEAAITSDVELIFAKDIARYRCRQKLSDRGSLMKKGDVLAVTAGQRYFLDRFEK